MLDRDGHLALSNMGPEPTDSGEHDMIRKRADGRVGRRASAAVAVIAIGLGASACSSEDVAERITEEAIENETGEDADVELGDDGQVQIQTEDGSMTVDEDGNVVIETPDGTTVVDAEGDAVNVDTGDGAAVSGDGETLTIEGDDGSSTYTAGGDIPDEWPDDLPLPDDATVLASSVMEGNGQNVITLSLNVDGELEEVGDSVKEQLEDAGWTDMGGMEAPDGLYWSFTKGDLSLALGAAPGTTNGGVDVNYVVSPTS